MRQGLRYIAEGFRHPTLGVLYVVIFLMSLGFNFFTQFFQVYLIEKFDFDRVQVGNLFAYIGLWAAFSQGLVQRWLCRWFGPYAILRVAALTLGLFLPVLLLPEQPHYLYWLIPLVSVSQGLKQPNITSLISLQAGPDQQGRTLGIMQSMQSLALILPPLVSGFLNALFIEAPILAGSLLTLAGWLLLVLRFGRKPRQQTA
jgi:DHA1 family tetracycline resistance protein-like MFS transporter